MSVEVIKFNNYVKPILSENKSKNWVLNGVNNSFYQYVIDRYNGSVTNATIINAYGELMYGRGLYAKDSSSKITQWAEFLSLIKPKEVRKVIADFELFGEASFQVIKQKGKKQISGVYHIAKNHVVPAIENEDGEIDGYWHSKDFSNSKTEPVYYPAFGTTNEAIEIYVIKPYRAGQNYFAYPDYFSGISYAELEEEITNFYLNAIRKGLSAGFIIGVPNGVGKTNEEKEEIKNAITRKLTGSKNAMDFIIDFHGEENDSMTVSNFPTNENIHKQWSYLSAEARQQLMTAHKVVSPMLFGIKDNTGFGNNADELDTAEAQLMKRVISPKQNVIIDAIKEIVSFNDIHLDLAFLPLTEVKNTNVNLSDEKKKTDLDAFIELGESESIEGYELESVKPVDYEEESKITLSVSTGTAIPNAKSKFDNDYYIYRYRYAGNASPERDFCKRMMGANKIYRREDIELMGDKNVNPGFGMHPAPNDPYSIWKFKGGGLLSASFTGGTCKHYWEKLTYKKKGIKIDVNNPNAENTISKASGIAGIAPHNI